MSQPVVKPWTPAPPLYFNTKPELLAMMMVKMMLKREKDSPKDKTKKKEVTMKKKVMLKKIPQLDPKIMPPKTSLS